MEWNRVAAFVPYMFFCFVLAVHLIIWNGSLILRPEWGNVPPPPSERGAAMLAAGDPQFGYRASGIMLQNLGNTGGRSMALKAYDYDRLGQWFFLLDRLDPQAVFMPFLAAYYFGAAQAGTDISRLLDYLEFVGARPGGQNWRWLAQAAFLAHYQQNDNARALDLAEKLSAQWKPGRPAWMKQMGAFLLLSQGDRAAAYELIMRIIRDEGDKLHPEEINSLVIYMCHQVLTPLQAEQHPLCTKAR